MAAGISDYGANLFVDVLTGWASMPATVYVALCLQQPDSGYDGTVLQGIEPPTSAAYARVALDMSTSRWTTAVNGSSATSVALSWAGASADWGIVNHYALCDDPTAGNLICWGELASEVRVGVGDTATMPIGYIALGASGPVEAMVL